MAATEQLNQYVVRDGHSGRESIFVEEGAFKGWVPKAIYSKTFYEVHLPFLRLLSFPCGGMALGSLSNDLTVFAATGNYLSQLPLAFAECRHMKKLDLSFNNFIQIPAVVFKLCKLEHLNFEHNYLQYVDRCIALLKNLKTLNLGGNLLTEIPDELRKCKNIRILNISGKFYAESESHIKTFPECVCHLSNLIQLNISWQKISEIPSCIGHLKKLEILNLKWSQLVEVSQDLRKCARLKRADLSGALRMRSAIPEALLCLEDVQSINLSDNFFMDIPQQVCGLVKINTLIAQRNSILQLSVDLYKLRYLEYLELNQNFIRSLPPGIRQLKRLRYLGLDSNELTSLPDELCLLENLTQLTIARNQLESLPENISQLSNLDYLNVNDNKLTQIPLLMDRLEKLASNDSFCLFNNNLRSPYKEMAQQGTQALFHFLKSIRVKEARHRWKMILIGAAHAGKTSLRRALMLGRSHLTDIDERTWVMERHLWEPESRLRVQLLDFGGHHVYQAAHHMFLSSDAFHILVFDLSKYRTELYHELIGHWLDAIMDRACGASIIIAGTHCDLCGQEDIDEKKEEILRLMRRNEQRRLNQIKKEIKKLTENLVNPHQGRGAMMGGIGATTGSNQAIPDNLEWKLQQKLASLQKMLNTRSPIPDQIHVLSCAGDLTGLSEFRSIVLDRLRVKQSTEMPDTWFQFLERLQHSTDENVVSFSNALDIFSEIMQGSPLSVGVGGSPERSLEMVLKYLHSTGEIIWYSDNERLRTTIFHRPEKLIDMLRAVFRHDFDRTVQFKVDVAELMSLQETKFDRMKRDFLKRGLMTKEFMQYLLVHLNLSEDGHEGFIQLILSLMLKFNLCFEVTNITTKALLGSAFVVQFPWFFQEEEPSTLPSKWKPQLPSGTFELNMEIVFYGQCPPNFFEKLSVKLHDFLSESDRDNWKDGVLAQKNSSTLLVRKENGDQGTVIAVSARGKDNLSELWSLLKDVRRAAFHLFLDWPMLKCDLYLLCMHCVLKGYEEPYRYPGDVLETLPPRGVYHKNCCDRSPEDSVPTCFVFPLEEPAYPEDQHSHYRHMQAALEFLHGSSSISSPDSVDGNPPTAINPLSDKIVSMLASKLGPQCFEMTVIELGVTTEQIALARDNYPHDLYRQIKHVLTEWRDGRNDHDDDADDDAGGGHVKLEKLLTVLSEEDIGRLDLVDAIKEKLNV